MKIFQSVLDTNLLTRIKFDINSKIPQAVWSNNTQNWQYHLYKHSHGLCLSYDLDGDLKSSILQRLKKYFPYYNDCGVKYHVWEEGSSIALHDDQKFLFGATLYLNKNWNPSYGGLFCYKHQEKYESIFPQYNSLVIVDEKEEHCVTPLGVNLPEPRYTVQFFAV